ncbi:hypothetical protein C8J56DRAFT_890571 [Mycena floridula]|nr:hypothetical protein C8J56DRAFT_890571 [Mycena floridula]
MPITQYLAAGIINTGRDGWRKESIKRDCDMTKWRKKKEALKTRRFYYHHRLDLSHRFSFDGGRCSNSNRVIRSTINSFRPHFGVVGLGVSAAFRGFGGLGGHRGRRVIKSICPPSQYQLFSCIGKGKAWSVNPHGDVGVISLPAIPPTSPPLLGIVIAPLKISAYNVSAPNVSAYLGKKACRKSCTSAEKSPRIPSARGEAHCAVLHSTSARCLRHDATLMHHKSASLTLAAPSHRHKDLRWIVLSVIVDYSGGGDYISMEWDNYVDAASHIPDHILARQTWNNLRGRKMHSGKWKEIISLQSSTDCKLDGEMDHEDNEETSRNRAMPGMRCGD